MMSTPLRVLILEDQPADAELTLHELRRADFEPEWARVETEQDYLAHLDPALDIILADYTLPQFDAARALRLLQDSGLDIPFIVVSGSVGEEVIVECMRRGAADYLLKDRLSRLGLAVRRALADRRLREEKQHAVRALQESTRQTRELQRFVSPPTAELIRSHKEITFGTGELREFAILFSDMRRFTPIAERLSPQVAFGILARSLKLQVEEVLTCGGHVDKIYGDGFLAYFDGIDRIERALYCALHIRGLVQQMPSEGDELALPVGLAINDGTVLFGMLGTKERMDHTVAGDVVNVCARLCGYANPFQIVVTDQVRQAVATPDRFSFHPLGPVSLKGKAEPLSIFEVGSSEEESMRKKSQ